MSLLTLPRPALGPRQNRSDTTLEALARASLTASPYREIRHLRCEAVGGVAILFGSVSSYYLKQLAQSVVLGLEGIKGVQNLLDVRERPSLRREDSCEDAERKEFELAFVL